MSDPRDSVRLWLRLLTTTTLVEAEIRRRLRLRFGTTLPRFDLMAALDRQPEGITLTEVSRRMMVSNGNITGLAQRLEEEGLIERRVSATDRRAQTLRLTARGRREFAKQSAEHADWVAELFGGLGAADHAALHRLLGRAKDSIGATLIEEAA